MFVQLEILKFLDLICVRLVNHQFYIQVLRRYHLVNTIKIGISKIFAEMTVLRRLRRIKWKTGGKELSLCGLKN